MSLVGLVLIIIFMNDLIYEAMDLQVTPTDRKCQQVPALQRTVLEPGEKIWYKWYKFFKKKISVVCHRYQLHEYKMGNVYVGCRTINKPEDYATPKLSKSKLHYMAEERWISLQSMLVRVPWVLFYSAGTQFECFVLFRAPHYKIIDRYIETNWTEFRREEEW